MRGYLQRLVHGVMHPQREIHPSVGSVYSARGQEAAASPAEEGFSAVGIQEGKNFAPSLAISRRVRASLGSGIPDAAAAAPLLPERRTGDVSRERMRQDFSGEPRSHEPSNDLPVASAEGHEEWPVRAEGKADRPAANIENNINIEDKDSEAVVPARAAEYLPLIRDFVVSEQTVIAEGTAVASRPTAVSGRALAPRRSPSHRETAQAAQRAQEQREPDEIEIHIGRIEVTAVPPPAQVRLAARPERKAVNLDEYLKRRHGRNR